MIRQFLLGALVLVGAAGCEHTELGSLVGAVKVANVPYDAHRDRAPPSATEVAANPCKYGDVAKCIEHCQTGDANACNALGVMFEFGKEEQPPDGTLASGFYARACDSDYAPGCTNLGWLYSLGRGVPHDALHAMALFTRAYEASRLACRRGDMSGCTMTGQALLDGRGVDADEKQALAYFRIACDGGDRQGCDYVSKLR